MPRGLGDQIELPSQLDDQETDPGRADSTEQSAQPEWAEGEELGETPEWELAEISEQPERETWRATGSAHPPAVVVGRMVHRALERWLFPEDPGLDPLLAAAAQDEGLVEPKQALQAVREVEKLLARFREHPLYAEVQAAEVRHHEMPYVLPRNRGVLDLLYRGPSGWEVLDFKTDELRDETALKEAIAAYRLQMRGYQTAAQALLREPVRVRIVFLDTGGEVRVEPWQL